ncbi:NADH-quinone oxidoreductase subunit NuoF [Desulfogranum japonicum]|uniref:NADH-quinone oxidoreductase subunit NuoF n=1 Tax=Desulfogranum japonicum TaxID=231447 RepID=UPI0004085764|nr:NADH-quinone oxidoreductase subunit NuoF [Desulfogranum japonicum]
MSFASIQQTAKEEWRQFEQYDRRRVLVGSATCGRAAGSQEVLRAFKKELITNNLLNQTDLYEVGCMGLCYAEVLVELRGTDGQRVLYQGVTPKDVSHLVESHLINNQIHKPLALAVVTSEFNGELPEFSELPFSKPQVRIVLRNCGIIDPTNVNHYIARGGYNGLARAVTLTQDQVIEEIKESGLRGRGGAGFPTGIKWAFARNVADEKKYVICNADEGDPGAFMDRSVLEGDPHAVLEGLVIAGYAIGANTGYVYCRAEYPLAVNRLTGAIAQMHEHGLLGQNIMGSGFSFEIHIKKGAGAFVCGEETSLMQSIEGKRAMPKPKPPFPAVSGLFGKPTNINNVETLAAVSAIMERGAAWYAGYGTEKSRGTKTFALAGKINRTGLIEVPLGTSLRTIIEEIGGGVPEGKKLKAVQTGGPSGGCIPDSFIESPVDYEHLAEVGSIMGSGGMIVIDEESCMVDMARYFLTFTENESCGKCAPCRMGTQHLLKILTDITEGRGEPSDLEKLRQIGATMRNGSLCGLGQTAANPVLTTLKYYEEEYLAHITDKKCPAGVCRDLIDFTIDVDQCTGCGACVLACPVNAIHGARKESHYIDKQMCIRCGSCRQACKFEAVLVI